MKKTEYNNDIDMTFTAGQNWQAEISLPVNALISEIHLRVYSFTFPDYIYGICWDSTKPEANGIKISITAFKPEHSAEDEAVRLAIDITYHSPE